MVEIARINHRHEQIINWLIANPDKPLGACAAEFGYTQAWLSQVIHSDAFQAVYRSRATELGELVTHTLKDRITAVALLAMDRSEKLLELGIGSERFVADIAKTTLGALGMPTVSNGSANGQQVQVNILVNKETLEASHRAAQEKRFGCVAPASREIQEGLGDLFPEASRSVVYEAEVLEVQEQA